MSAVVARPGRLDLLRGAGQVLGTSLGRRVLATYSLVAFGIVSAIIEFLAAVFRSFPPHPAITFAASLAVCVAWGMIRAYPRFHLHRRLRTVDVTLSIVVGDLFAQDTHLAVGFSDTFDTSVADDRVIHSSSVQGQLLRRLYADNQDRLDQQLGEALSAISPVRMESRADKPYGKLARYPMGTVAVLGEPRRLIFAIAYGSMGNDLVVRAPVEDLWYCFNQLWEAVYRNGQRGALSIPLMGSGLARVDSLDRENLLRLILLSFVAYSRLRLICHDLRVVIRPEDVDRVDLVGLRAFLQTL
ncbi:MAG TPA: macro domain-containing protein [Streptosporangiaceae bacterium]|nr:macro domain-containing protein [Streptosporangiaceae bacterium]